MQLLQLDQEQPPKQLCEHTRTGNRNLGHETQRSPSSEIPPRGTIMWMCGWCVIAEPPDFLPICEGEIWRGGNAAGRKSFNQSQALPT